MLPDEKTNGHRARPSRLRAEAASEELGRILRQMRLELRGLLDGLKSIAALEWKRLRLRAIDGLLGAAILLAAFIATITAAVAAAYLVVTGARHALARLGGAEWVGELGAGALILAILYLAGRLVRGRVQRRLLADALGRGARRKPR